MPPLERTFWLRHPECARIVLSRCSSAPAPIGSGHWVWRVAPGAVAPLGISKVSAVSGWRSYSLPAGTTGFPPHPERARTALPLCLSIPVATGFRDWAWRATPEAVVPISKATAVSGWMRCSPRAETTWLTPRFEPARAVSSRCSSARVPVVSSDWAWGIARPVGVALEISTATTTVPGWMTCLPPTETTRFPRGHRERAWTSLSRCVSAAVPIGSGDWASGGAAGAVVTLAMSRTTTVTGWVRSLPPAETTRWSLHPDRASSATAPMGFGDWACSSPAPGSIVPLGMSRATTIVSGWIGCLPPVQPTLWPCPAACLHRCLPKRR